MLSSYASSTGKSAGATDTRPTMKYKASKKCRKSNNESSHSKQSSSKPCGLHHKTSKSKKQSKGTKSSSKSTNVDCDPIIVEFQSNIPTDSPSSSPMARFASPSTSYYSGSMSKSKTGFSASKSSKSSRTSKASKDCEETALPSPAEHNVPSLSPSATSAVPGATTSQPTGMTPVPSISLARNEAPHTTVTPTATMVRPETVQPTLYSSPSQTPSSEPTSTPESTSMPTDEPTNTKTVDPTSQPTQDVFQIPSGSPSFFSTKPATSAANTDQGEVTTELNESVLDGNLEICRCSQENLCLPEPLPQGSELKVCFFISPTHWIRSIDSLYLEQPEFYWDTILSGGTKVRNDTIEESNESRTFYSISTPVDDSFFLQSPPPSLYIKGVAIIDDNVEDLTRRRLETAEVAFSKQVELESSSFQEGGDDTGQVIGEVNLEETRSYFWVVGICLGIITGAVYIAKKCDKAGCSGAQGDEIVA